MDFNSDSKEFNYNSNSQNNFKEETESSLENKNEDLNIKSTPGSEQINGKLVKRNTEDTNDDVAGNLFYDTNTENASSIQAKNSKIQNKRNGMDQEDPIHYFQPKVKSPRTDAQLESIQHNTLSRASKRIVVDLNFSFDCSQDDIGLNSKHIKLNNLNSVHCTNTEVESNGCSSTLESISSHFISSKSALNDQIDPMDLVNGNKDSNTRSVSLDPIKKCQPSKRKNNDFSDKYDKKACYEENLSNMNSVQRIDETRKTELKNTGMKFSPDTAQKYFLEFINAYIYRYPSHDQCSQNVDSESSVNLGDAVSDSTGTTYFQMYQHITEQDTHKLGMNKRCETSTENYEQPMVCSTPSELVESGAANTVPGFEEGVHMKTFNSPSVSYHCFNNSLDHIQDVNEIRSGESHQHAEVKYKSLNTQSKPDSEENINSRNLFEYENVNASCKTNLGSYDTKDVLEVMTISPVNKNATSKMLQENASLLLECEINKTGECIDSSFQNFSFPESNLNFASGEISQFHLDSSPGSADFVSLETGQQEKYFNRENFIARNVFVESVVQNSKTENATSATLFGENRSSTERMNSEKSCTKWQRFPVSSLDEYCSLDYENNINEFQMEFEEEISMPNEIYKVTDVDKNISVLSIPINQELYFQKHPHSSSAPTNNYEIRKEDGISQDMELNASEPIKFSNSEIKEINSVEISLNMKRDNKLPEITSGTKVSTGLQMDENSDTLRTAESNPVKNNGYFIGHILKYPKRHFPRTCRFQVQDNVDPIDPILQFKPKTKIVRNFKDAQVEPAKHNILRNQTAVTEGEININSYQDISSLSNEEQTEEVQLNNSNTIKHTIARVKNTDRKIYFVNSCSHREISTPNRISPHSLQSMCLNTSRFLREDSQFPTSRVPKLLTSMENYFNSNLEKEAGNGQLDRLPPGRLDIKNSKPIKVSDAQICSEKDEYNADTQRFVSMQKKTIDSQTQQNCSFQSHSIESNELGSNKFCKRPTGKELKECGNTKIHPVRFIDATSCRPNGLTSNKVTVEAIESMKSRAEFKIRDILNYIWERNASVPFLSALHSTRIALNEYLSTGTVRLSGGKYEFVQNFPPEEEMNIHVNRSDRSITEEMSRICTRMQSFEDPSAVEIASQHADRNRNKVCVWKKQQRRR